MNIQSDLFKFVALRPPMPPSQDAASRNFTADDRTAKDTPVGRFVAQFNVENAATIPERLKAFIAAQKYDLAFPQSAGDTTLSATLAAANFVTKGEVSTQALIAAIQVSTDKQISALYASDDAKKMREALWDRYYAFYLLSGFEGQDLTALTTNLRSFHLLNLLYRGQAVPDDASLQSILSATPIIDKVFMSLPKPRTETAAPPDKTLTPAKATEYSALWKQLIDTNSALTDVRTLNFVATKYTETKDIEPSIRLTSALARTDAASGVNATATAAGVAKQTTVAIQMKVDPEHFARMSASSQAVLKTLNITAANLDKASAVRQLNDNLQALSAKIDAIDDPLFLSVMPSQAMEIRGLSHIVSRLNGIAAAPKYLWPGLFGDNVLAEIKPLGIGDLKVVKQKLVSYQLGEVAHIENVLRGEYKERKYRVLDRTEQTLDITTENNEETTKDTQTTERFELKKESDKTISEQMSVQAGVTVSGSYGMVTFGAHGDFAYSTSSQESTKNASNFAREVVDKAVTRIQKNVKQEQITKQLHEVEEIDTHGLDNKGQPDNLTGVYRWVDKYYEAQIYNYGKRLMFEFIIPEPAAFYTYAQTHKPQRTIVPPPALPANLTHKDITENNYQWYIRNYQVQGCVPPPSEQKVVSVTLSSDAKIENGTALAKSSKDLVVPEGYVCDSIAASLSFIYENYPEFRLSVGADNFAVEWHTNKGLIKIDWASGSTYAFTSIIPVSIDIYDLNSYFVNVIANCSRSWQTYETWQIQTFEKIMAAYQAQKASYDQQVAAQQTQQGVVIHGQNPLINRQIEKMELKKGCVKLLVDTWRYGTFGAMKQVGDNPPDFDIHQAISEGKFEQFFEQAFEWENITYLFYPYFWGRQNQWLSKINNYDDDPLFTQFLQSGSARVVVPVHPGYNDAVMYYLENNGAIWNGGEPPRLNDPLYISLAQELRDITDDLANATPEGDPWQVILPTTLVYLQKDSTLPTFP
ncbi:MAG: hypothetical protein JSR71_09035 [Proteobacteria bacterium]|nr:hypothetical protein [Pseudomonadota bacterium]